MQGIMDVAAGNCEVLSNAYMGALKLVEQLQECSWDEHILRCQVHGVMWSKVYLEQLSSPPTVDLLLVR